MRAYRPIESGLMGQESSMGPYRIADANRASGLACYGQVGARCLVVIY